MKRPITINASNCTGVTRRNLMEVSKVLAGIGRSCPNLVNLAFSNIPVFELPAQPVSEWFNKLEAVELWSSSNVEYNPILVRQLLLFSPNLRNILFNSCTVVTDNLFIDIMQNNSLENLSHLTFDQCHGISMATVDAVLDAENKLTVLRLWSCARITRLHSSQVSKRIKEENLDILFEWFQYEE